MKHLSFLLSGLALTCLSLLSAPPLAANSASAGEETLSPRQQYEKVLQDVAAAEGLSVEEIKKQIEEASSVYNYFLNRYLQGKLSSIEEAMRIVALSKNIQPLPSELSSLTSSGSETLARLRNDDRIVVKEIAYRSSIEDIYPLYAEICYDPRQKNAPIAVIQHGGNPGSRLGIVSSCYRMAKKGLFGVAVSKRGRDGSAGEGDSWAKETFDIIDAVEYVKEHYAAFVDPTSVSIWGYSGGAIDSAAAATRFPDYFRCVAPFFGQLEWTTTFEGVPVEQRRKHAAKGEEQKVNAIVDGIGGYPDEVPDNYMARNNMLGVINNPYSKIHLILDEKDPSGPHLQRHFREYFRKAQELGYTNVELHLSKTGDVYRWHHAHPGSWAQLGNPDLLMAENLFIPHILNGDYPEPVLADSGTINVLGYVKTKRFFVWLGNGNDAVAQLEYTLAGKQNTFVFRRLSEDPKVKGELTFPNPQGHPLTVTINGKVEVEETNVKQVKVGFSLDDTVVISELEK